jgi:nitrous oxidase accessory protein NosD
MTLHMKKFLLILLFTPLFADAQLTELKPGMKISQSVKVRRAVYALNAKTELATPVIEITGENIVVDFDGATLRGSNDKQMPNEYYGLAVLIKGGKNITIRNLNARGYKVALMARDVEGLTIENCNLSYNYRQRLNSTQEKEDISDWMSYHQNEKDEWLRYGAAMYLRNCNKAVIKNNIVTGGQCALMLTQCNDGQVLSNNFSFNSAIGIGMYRSSRNNVFNNKLDWNVRGHSEGVYNRGQDSAAILVFEQCNNNSFAYNSATHSGDGFFLWAGQTTMDTGEGGCNDNYLYANDFSHAPTNGIEVTFSRNRIERNKMEECDHGIWGGYSFKTLIRRNIFTGNRIAIAIEHGQDNRLVENTFMANRESMRLWARKEQPKDWGYAQKRDTRSRDYQVTGNWIIRDSLVYNLSNTTGIKLVSNVKERNRVVYKLDSAVGASIDTAREGIAPGPMEVDNVPLFPYEEAAGVKLPESHPRGRREIRITEWGPYDFRSPLIWRTNPLDTTGLLKFDIIGPPGGWKLVSSRGVGGISYTSGRIPYSISARKLPNYKGDIFIELEYTGQQVTTPFGEVIGAGKPYRFAFRDARVPMKWQVKWFAFDSATNPVKDAGQVSNLQTKAPVMTREVRDFNFAWWGGINADGQKIARFLTVAESDVEVEPGNYELSVTWDDAVRVYMDGKLVINEWNPSLYKFDESPNKAVRLRLGGRHKWRVEHAELGGFATISLKLKGL